MQILFPWSRDYFPPPAYSLFCPSKIKSNLVEFIDKRHVFGTGVLVTTGFYENRMLLIM